MLKNDTLRNGTSRIGLYGSAPGIYQMISLQAETKLSLKVIRGIKFSISANSKHLFQLKSNKTNQS